MEVGGGVQMAHPGCGQPRSPGRVPPAPREEAAPGSTGKGGLRAGQRTGTDRELPVFPREGRLPRLLEHFVIHPSPPDCPQVSLPSPRCSPPLSHGFLLLLLGAHPLPHLATPSRARGLPAGFLVKGLSAAQGTGPAGNRPRRPLSDFWEDEAE